MQKENLVTGNISELLGPTLIKDLGRGGGGCNIFYKDVAVFLLLLLRSQSHAQMSSPVLTRKSAVRRRDAVGPQSFSFVAVFNIA